jgi:hypothetical protein
LVEGQSLYNLSYKANVSVDRAKKFTEKSKFFQTKAQGYTEKEEVNLSGDNYVCQQTLNQLKTDLFEDYNDFIDSEARKKTSP